MNTIALSGTTRVSNGTKGAAQLRREERVPCVLYGTGDNMHFSVDEKALRKVVFTPEFHGVELNIDGTTTTAFVREVQFHPVTDRVLHVDFLAAQDNKPVKAVISLRLVGQSPGVREGGKLRQTKRRIAVKGLPADLPSFLDVDVSKLGMGDSARVRDLQYKGLSLLDNPNDVVVSVKVSKRDVSAAATAAAAEKKGEKAK
jgi:large subunit ribosomal protein L25